MNEGEDEYMLQQFWKSISDVNLCVRPESFFYRFMGHQDIIIVTSLQELVFAVESGKWFFFLMS